MTTYLYDSDISLPAGLQDQIARVVEQHLRPTNTSGSGALQNLLSMFGLTIDNSGNINANVVPRTGNLATLLVTAGTVGEIASALDYPSLVKLSGNTTGAVAFHSFGATYTKTFDSSYSGVQTIPSWGLRSYISIDATNPVAFTMALANGYYPGQRMTLDILQVSGVSAVTISTDSTVNGGFATWSTGYSYELRWDGVAWAVLDILSISSTVPGAFSAFGGQVFTGTSGVAIGAGATINNLSQLMLSNGNTTLACANYNETGIAAGSKSYHCLTDLVATSTAASTAYELTLDGNAATSTNRYAGIIGEAGIMRVQITLQARAGTSQSDVWSNTYDLCLAISSLGAIALVGAVVAGTAISGGGTIGTPTVAITVASNRMKIVVTTSATNTSSTKWIAAVRSIKQVM